MYICIYITKLQNYITENIMWPNQCKLTIHLYNTYMISKFNIYSSIFKTMNITPHAILLSLFYLSSVRHQPIQVGPKRHVFQSYSDGRTPLNSCLIQVPTKQYRFVQLKESKFARLINLCVISSLFPCVQIMFKMTSLIWFSWNSKWYKLDWFSLYSLRY